MMMIITSLVFIIEVLIKKVQGKPKQTVDDIKELKKNDQSNHDGDDGIRVIRVEMVQHQDDGRPIY